MPILTRKFKPLQIEKLNKKRSIILSWDKILSIEPPW